MPLYEYKCAQCQALIDSSTRADFLACTNCGGRAQRRFSFAHHTDMPAHYNPNTGTYINNERKFKEDLKRISAERTERTGILHDFVPTDPRDMKGVGATSEGLDSTYDRMNESERKILKPYLDKDG